VTEYRPSEPAQSLTTRVVRGALVKLLGGMPVQLIGILTTLLCFRVLTPAAYGSYGLAVAIYGFTDIFTNPSVSSYLIRQHDCSSHAINVAFTISAVRGILLTPFFWLIAPELASLFDGGPEVTGMLRILCLSFLFSGLNNLHVIRFHQELKMGKVLLVESLGAFVGTLTTVAILYFYRTPLGLVLGSAVGAGLNMGLSWFLGPERARFVWDREELKRLWNFTRFLLINSLIIYALLNLDDLIVARLAGVASLGVYAISYNLVNSALLFLVRPLRAIVLPALARLKDNRAQLTVATTSVLSTFSFISWAICSSVWPVAEDLFRVLGHGDKWSEAVPVLRALLPFVLIRGINGSLGPLLLALGKPKLLTMVSGPQLLLMVPLGWLGYSEYGFLGLVLAITLLNGLAMVGLVVISSRYLDVSIPILFATMLLPMAAALLAGGVGTLLSGHFETALAGLLGGLLGALITFALAWELTCRMPLGAISRRSILGLVQQIRGRGN